MGAYKGRVRLRQRKRRFAKDRRIKSLAAKKKVTTPPQDAAPPEGPRFVPRNETDPQPTPQ
jgi:hypothetical protein